MWVRVPPPLPYKTHTAILKYNWVFVIKCLDNILRLGSIKWLENTQAYHACNMGSIPIRAAQQIV